MLRPAAHAATRTCSNTKTTSLSARLELPAQAAVASGIVAADRFCGNELAAPIVPRTGRASVGRRSEKLLLNRTRDAECLPDARRTGGRDRRARSVHEGNAFGPQGRSQLAEQ